VSAVHEIGSEVHSVQDRFLADEVYHVGSGNGATYASSMLQREKSHGLKDGIELTVGARVARDGPASCGRANDRVITSCGLMVSRAGSAERYRAKNAHPLTTTHRHWSTASATSRPQSRAAETISS
jgi:hypothetical protein